MNAQEQLLRDAFGCTHCQGKGFGFSAPDNKTPDYKFPPTIGAPDRADLLFVGINPRISTNPESEYYNKDLFDKIVTDQKAFEDLAANVNPVDGQKYISKYCDEEHYHHHVAIVEAMYGIGAKFEDHAAVTELFLCASANASQLPKDDYPCANRFFDRVFLEVRPRMVICVWESVFNYFKKQYQGKDAGSENFLLTVGGHSSIVVYLPHPNMRHP